MSINNQTSKSISLKRNSAWNALGSLVYSLTQWGLIIAIAKNGTLEMIGIFTLSLALTAPVVLLTRLNLSVAVVSDVKREFHFTDYYTSRIISIIVSIIILLIVAILYPTDNFTRAVIIIISIAKGVESVSDILYGNFQKNERLDIVAKSRILKGLISLVVFSTIMHITNNLLFASIGLMLTWIITLVFYDIKNNNSLFGSAIIKINKNNQLLILKLTLPLGLAQIIASLNSNVPRYFIEYFHGIETLGIFAAIIYIIVAGTNLFLAISSATLSKLSLLFQRSMIKEFIFILLKLISIVVIIGVISLVIVYNFGGNLLAIVYSNQYKDFGFEFFLFTLMGFVMYINIFIDTGLSATRKFIIQPYINSIILVIVTVSSVVLIPSFGILGAAYSLIIAQLIQLFIKVFILGYLLRKRFNLSRI